MNTATPRASASCLKDAIPTTALLTLCVLTSPAATADTTPVTRSTNVSLTDLNLSTPEGIRLARDRLRVTARRLCAAVADDLDIAHQPHFVACVDETLAAALRKVTEPSASKVTAKATDAYEVSPCAVSRAKSSTR